MGPKGLQLQMVDVTKAPNAKIINWHNLHYAAHHMFCRHFCIMIAMLLLLVFWSIPVIAIQGLANLDSLFKAFGGDVNDVFGPKTVLWLQGSLTVLVLDVFLLS